MNKGARKLSPGELSDQIIRSLFWFKKLFSNNPYPNMSLFDFSFLAVNLVFEKDPCGSVLRFKGSSDLGEGLTEISRHSVGA